MSFFSSIHNEEASAKRCPSELSTVDQSRSGFLNQRSNIVFSETNQIPNIQHELSVAISILQQGSRLTGDCLFDHLADIIKLVIQEGPANIVDYFEELSYNMREQKIQIAERFPWTYFEPIDVERAKSIMKLMNLPIQTTDNEYNVCKENAPKYTKSIAKVVPRNNQSVIQLERKLNFNENVPRLQLYWALCGFGLQDEEVSQLSYAIQKIHCHQAVEHARFWGKIYGLIKSYYIVEVLLTKSEIELRLEKMKEEFIENMKIFQERKNTTLDKEEDLNLIPGAKWLDSSKKEIENMNPIPKPCSNPTDSFDFEIPPEAIGTGLNRRTYFVVNCLNEEWVELPIVTPQQIQISKKIKKFLTGDLDADVASYPTFPGTEKHYLRAIIARITSGTYVVPDGYYRKLTKEEIILSCGDSKSQTEDDVIELNDKEEVEDNDTDVIIVENEEYKPSLNNLMSPKSWVHVRPYILEQGRVVHFDEKKAFEALEEECSLQFGNEEKVQEKAEEKVKEEAEEADLEGENEIFEEIDDAMETSNPAIFSTCNNDENNEEIEAWSVRLSSTHNKINQLIILRSNLWPGAYSFTFDKYSDSIYLGWGLKYTARNMTVSQIPSIQDDYDSNGFAEISDPTVEMEKAWQLFQDIKLIDAMFEGIVGEEEESC